MFYRFSHPLMILLVCISMGLACVETEPDYQPQGGSIETGGTQSNPTMPGNTQNNAPLFKRLGDKLVEVGEEFSLFIEVIDPNGDRFSVSADPLPIGAQFNESTLTFTWTPTIDQLGEHRVNFTADDGRNQASKTVLITVVNEGEGMNLPPQVESVLDKTILAGEETVLVIEASDPNSDLLTFTLLPGAPDGLTISEDGILRWTPSIEQANRQWRIVFQVSDGTLAVSGQISLTVQEPGTAGVEAGTTAGTMAGMTAGVEAGTTAGTTAGDNAGTTAGDNAGTTAGDNAGTTAGTSLDDCDLYPPARIEVFWEQINERTYTFGVQPYACFYIIEYYANEEWLGTGIPETNQGRITYEFPSFSEGINIRVDGSNYNYVILSQSYGLIDVTAGVGVNIQQLDLITYDTRTYKIELTRAPDNMASMEVYVDDYLLTDYLTDETRHNDLEMIYRFDNPGFRSMRIQPFDNAGNELPALIRNFSVNDR